MSTTSSPTLSPQLYAPELANMMNDDETISRISHDFSNDVTGTLALRYIQSLSDTIKKLEENLKSLQDERDDVFAYAIDSVDFRRTLRPIVRAHRRRQLSPYARTDTPPSLQSNTTSDNSPPFLYHPSINEHPEPPRTVTILSRNPSPEQSLPINSDPSSSYHTVDDGRMQMAPHSSIRRPHTPHPRTGFLRRTQSAPIADYCNICTRVGHSQLDCVWRGPIICSYCREVGHTRGNCNDLRLDIVRFNPRYQYCTICDQAGHTVDRCFARQFTHYQQ